MGGMTYGRVRCSGVELYVLVYFSTLATERAYPAGGMSAPGWLLGSFLRVRAGM